MSTAAVAAPDSKFAENTQRWLHPHPNDEARLLAPDLLRHLQEQCGIGHAIADPTLKAMIGTQLKTTCLRLVAAAQNAARARNPSSRTITADDVRGGLLLADLPVPAKHVQHGRVGFRSEKSRLKAREATAARLAAAAAEPAPMAD